MKPDSKLATTENGVAPATRLFSVLLAFVCFGLAAVRASTVYIAADNLEGTNLFGTLDVATGQFSQIASTGPLFLALTNGPGGKIYGADANSGHLFTISTSGATIQYGSVTAPSAFYGLAYSRSAGKFFDRQS
jgi:hypothetical protein